VRLESIRNLQHGLQGLSQPYQAISTNYAVHSRSNLQFVSGTACKAGFPEADDKDEDSSMFNEPVIIIVVVIVIIVIFYSSRLSRP
jgi:hypothetical protein